MDDPGLVGAKPDLAGLRIPDREFDVLSNRTDLRIRHQASWTQHTTELPNDTHGIRGSNDRVVIDVASLHLFSQIFEADNVGARSTGLVGIRTLCEYSNA